MAQRIDTVESTLNKRIDGLESNLNQKIDNLQYSITKINNILELQERGRFPSQTLPNPKGVHEVGSSNNSGMDEVKSVITLRSGREIEQPVPMVAEETGSPTISVNIGGTCIDKALLDLGASVNLLPYLVYKQLGLGELKPINITLSLADRLVKIPKGIVKDVLVKVHKFYYPVDFVVLDTEPIASGPNHGPIILGRPFFATANAIINC